MARTISSPATRIGPILLVDDYEDARVSVREALESSGYSVIEAANGQQALDTLVTLPVRVAMVILDLQMPVMNGWQLLELMRCYVGLSAIPVIVVTAHEARADEFKHAGIVTCIHAPYVMEELVRTVDSVLSGARKPGAALAEKKTSEA